MFKSWKSRVGVLALTATMGAGLVGLANPAGATEDAATASCKNDGWKPLLRSDGTAFKNQGDCVSYVVRGGELGTACFDPTSETMAFDFRLTAPVDTSANTTMFWSSDGTCSGGVLLKDTTVVASDLAQAVSKCATITGASGDYAFQWQPGYPTAPGNWWGCGVYV